MATELKIPELGESITEVEIGEWLKAEGDSVEKDEPLATLESEKATVELPAPTRGRLSKILKTKGQTAKVGESIGQLDTAGGAEPSPRPVKARKDPGGKDQEEEQEEDQPSKQPATAEADTEPDQEPETDEPTAEQEENSSRKPAKSKRTDKDPRPASRVMPGAERLLVEHDLRAEDVKGTGPGGRILKEDVLRHVEERPAPKETAPRKASLPRQVRKPVSGDREEEVVPMSPLRRKLAQRLVVAQQTAALLTTFNEIDLSAVIQLRREFGEPFQAKYGIKLGFMSFFIKAVIDGLKVYPQLNAEVRGQDIVYRNYYDIGVAIGAGKGLVVPVIRDAERLSFAEIELTVADFAQRAQTNKLKIDELQGGTFTISNGGVYGSLLSTPIVNPPQSGILGMHAIQDRPIARDGAVVIRPMMYIALTYDHRIVDGREAVSFLRRIREAIEAPSRMLLEV